MLSTTNGGTITESFTDAQIIFTGSVDTTKKLKFDCSTVATGTTVTIKAPTTSGNALVDSAVNLSITNSGTTGQVLTSLGSNTASFQTPSSSSTPSINVITMTTSGTYTPTTNMKYIEVQIVGGGGNGGSIPATSGSQSSAGGGGGGGAYACQTFSNTVITTAGIPITVTVGGPSATTSFGSLLSASGGGNGFAGSIGGQTNIGTGGSTYTGSPSIHINGGFGSAGYVISNIAIGGIGGSSFLSTNGTPTINSYGIVGGEGGGRTSGGGYGAGGGGTAISSYSQGGQIGGDGISGVCIIKEYIFS